MVGPEFKVLECSAVCCSFCLLTCVLVAKCECVLERKRLKRKTVSQHLKTFRNEKRNSRFSIEEVLVLGTFFSLFSEKIIPDIYDCCGLRTQWGDRSFRIEASFWVLVPWSMIHDPNLLSSRQHFWFFGRESECNKITWHPASANAFHEQSTPKSKSNWSCRSWKCPFIGHLCSLRTSPSTIHQ